MTHHQDVAIVAIAVVDFYKWFLCQKIIILKVTYEPFGSNYHSDFFCS